MNLNKSQLKALGLPENATPEQMIQAFTDAQARASEAEAVAEKAKKAQTKLTCKVSEKGCISVYGLGRWPVSLYASQWDRLIDFNQNITEFAQDNEAELTKRADASKAAKAAK